MLMIGYTVEVDLSQVQSFIKQDGSVEASGKSRRWA
jgi:hypothetical protein